MEGSFLNKTTAKRRSSTLIVSMLHNAPYCFRAWQTCKQLTPIHLAMRKMTFIFSERLI